MSTSENGTENATNYQKLGHELAHKYSEIKGFKDNSIWDANPLRIRMPSKDEWYASLVENMIRSDQGDNLRTHYIAGDENYRIISTPTPQLIFNYSTGKTETILQYTPINDPRDTKNMKFYNKQ